MLLRWSTITGQSSLVGVLEHFFSSIYWEFIIPTDFVFFQRGGSTTNQIKISKKKDLDEITLGPWPGKCLKPFWAHWLAPSLAERFEGPFMLSSKRIAQLFPDGTDHVFAIIFRDSSFSCCLLLIM